MKPNFLLAVALLGIGMTGVAVADDVEHPYIGLDYTLLDYKNSNSNTSDSKPQAARLRVGSVVTPYIGVEAQLLTGIKSSTLNVNTSGGTTPYDLSLNLGYGVFIRPQLPLGPITVYGLGGYSHALLDVKDNTGLKTTKTFDGFSYGAGASLELTQNLGVNADLIQYFTGLEAFSVGGHYRF